MTKNSLAEKGILRDLIIKTLKTARSRATGVAASAGISSGSPGIIGAQMFENRPQFRSRVLKPGTADVLFRHDHDVRAGQTMQIQAKKFPQDPFHAVASGGFASLFGNRDTRARNSAGFFDEKKNIMRAMILLAMLVTGKVFGALADPRFFWKRK